MNFNIFQIAMNINGPPGIIHPLLQENYAWVDEGLREKYYNNFDNFYKWADKELLKPTPITWANYKSREILKCIEDNDDNELFITCENRKRAESDISNYEVNVGKVILNAYSNSLLDNHIIEEYEFEELFTNYSEESEESQESEESEESYYSYDSY
jgi:hypothetical protein